MKKLSAVLLAAAAAVILCAAASAACLGDVIADGAVTAEDARAILRAAVDLEPLTGETWLRADLDEDGVLRAGDARLALRTAVQLEAPREVPPETGLQGLGTVVDVSSRQYTYYDMVLGMKIFAAAAPRHCSYRSLGVTADGREILCLVLGTGRGSKQIAVDAGIHGSEYLNPAAVMSAVEYYLRHYDTVVYHGKTVRQLLADTDLYFIPMLNPDGIAISQSGLAGLWNASLAEGVKRIYETEYNAGRTGDSLSTYLKEWRSNAHGVDLNRNFLFETTGLRYDSGVTSPANGEYAGNRDAQEAETVAYKKMFNGLSNPVAVLSIHSQGSLVYWDCGQSEAGKKAAKALTDTICGLTGYYADPYDSFLGASADWTMIEKNVPSVTVETGKGRNPLSLSDQAGIAEKLCFVFLAAAEMY